MNGPSLSRTSLSRSKLSPNYLLALKVGPNQKTKKKKKNCQTSGRSELIDDATCSKQSIFFTFNNYNHSTIFILQ